MTGTAKALKLSIELEPRKGMLGRVTGYVARKGQLEGEGKTKDEACAALLTLIERVASENAAPVVKLGKSGIWLAYREAYGTWFYRTPRGGACMTGKGGRQETIDAMLRHMEQNEEI